MKTTKIWGVRGGLIGDTIMALPTLEYLKRKHPNSYVNWVIHKKCSQAAPIYINQKNIDKIHITEGWESLGKYDSEIKSSCDIQINEMPPVVDHFSFNKISCVEIVANMAGYFDIDFSGDKRFPKLEKWWVNPSTQNNPVNHGYSQNKTELPKENFTVGILPFAHYGQVPERSPTKEWWDVVCDMLIKSDYETRHFGWGTEPKFNGVLRYTNHSYFEQIKLALECDVVIGTDSGSMWVLGAYSQPAIHIMTYHMHGHNDNESALLPENKNGVMLFNPKSCNLISPKLVLENIKEYEENKIK